jgi:tetratricopeptide (TPR) repeat protein
VGPAIQEAIAAEKIGIRESLNVKPQTPQSLYRLAEGYQALSFLSSLWVLQTNPHSHRAHQLKAQSYEAAGHLDEAVSEYRGALAQKPDLQTIHFAIGNLYWRRALLDEALAELREELKVSPNDPQAHYEIGDILFSQEQSEEAEKHFEQAIRYAPSMAEAHLAIERIANVKGDSDKALAHLKKAAEISPEDPTPHYRMWVLYRRLGKPEEARVARAAFEARKNQNQSKTGLKP